MSRPMEPLQLVSPSTSPSALNYSSINDTYVSFFTTSPMLFLLHCVFNGETKLCCFCWLCHLKTDLGPPASSCPEPEGLLSLSVCLNLSASLWSARYYLYNTDWRIIAWWQRTEDYQNSICHRLKITSFKLSSVIKTCQNASGLLQLQKTIKYTLHKWTIWL